MKRSKIDFNLTDCFYDDILPEKEYIKEVKEAEMRFIDKQHICLYTALNRTNSELLKHGEYKGILIASEYPELAASTSQAEVVLAVSYDTEGLYDTLHPTAYKEISKLAEELKKGHKGFAGDEDILHLLLTKCSGVRVHSIDITKKCYKDTKMIFGGSRLVYFLKHGAVKVVGETEVGFYAKRKQ